MPPRRAPRGKMGRRASAFGAKKSKTKPTGSNLKKKESGDLCLPPIEQKEEEEKKEETPVLHQYLRQARQSWSKGKHRTDWESSTDSYASDIISDDDEKEDKEEPHDSDSNHSSPLSPSSPVLPDIFNPAERKTPILKHASMKMAALPALSTSPSAKPFKLKETTKRFLQAVRKSSVAKREFASNPIQYLEDSNELPKVTLDNEANPFTEAEDKDKIGKITKNLIMSSGTPYNVPLSQASKEAQPERLHDERSVALMSIVTSAKNAQGNPLFSIDETTMEPAMLYHLLHTQPNLLTYFVTPLYTSGPRFSQSLRNEMQTGPESVPGVSKRRQQARRGGDGGGEIYPPVLPKQTAQAPFLKSKHERHITPSSLWSMPPQVPKSPESTEPATPASPVRRNTTTSNRRPTVSRRQTVSRSLPSVTKT